VDLVCSRIMGFDHEKIPTFRHVIAGDRYVLFDGDPGRIDVLADRVMNFDDVCDACGCRFVPSRGWRGHIEYAKDASARTRQEEPVRVIAGGRR
jgi:hypothetical protein